MSTPRTETPSIDARTAPYAALLLRVGLGAMLLAHGLLLKVVTFGVAGTAGYFQSLGYPAVFAYLVILGEIGGGLALILGVWTRWIALLMLPILIGATLQHLGNGWVFSAKGGGWEFPVFWIVALVVQALLGDGAYALRPAFLTGRSARLGAAVTETR
ncbi:DoxX family protein [Rhodoplanes sp. TEM]|uniref:DoxX family protein n=1 Tax=Rhodoplanes tepidamans TaxID=200616 RepID=A0ABT5JDB2_RHOTP|nr:MULTISPECIES: DoxX family protein [Rhodoplanes]MDC7787443.1 DoxX family protein [Rhodoplanes tepidamans]MDC7986352.1 DoxX family protein [Rhodoplanes sp. TEM]MDQ0358071.1 putative oxidoreductase [Rhodoplanes tepidamans]